MSKKNKKVAKASLFAMITEMWADVRSGKVDAMSINLTKYAEKYHVGKFKRSMIIPYITQDTCPTYEQACKLRKEVSDYINDRQAKQQPARPEIIEPSLFDIDIHITPKDVVISECISFLKKEGYVIFKKV
jgi:hypothetical protein